jgi:hypothetical protein
MPHPTPTNASFETFARTGRLGGVGLGDTRAALALRLGKPTDWLARRPMPESGLWKYGDVEFHFDDDDRVWLIHCDNYTDAPQGGGGLLLDPWVVRASLTLAQMEQALHDANGAFTSEVDRLYPGRVELVTAVGVRFNVVVEPEEFVSDLPIVSRSRSGATP